jgi:hypothetical protein
VSSGNDNTTSKIDVNASINNPRYGVEIILSPKTIHTRNHSSADLDSYLVTVLEREGFDVMSILSHRQTKQTWTKCPH